MFKKLLLPILLALSFNAYSLTFPTIITVSGISSTNSLAAAQANRVAIQNAVDSCTDPLGCTVRIIDKDAYIESAAQTCNNSSLRGIAVKNNVRINLLRSYLKVFPNACQSYSIFRFWNVHDAELVMDRSSIIYGDKTTHTYTNDGQPCSVVINSHECGNLISITNSQNIVISYGTITQATGDGIYIGGNTTTTNNILVYYVNLDNNRRQGMSIINGNNITVEKNNLINTGGNGTANQYVAPGLGLDIEVDNCNQRVTNLIVRNNYFGNNFNGGIKVYSPVCPNNRNITTDDVYQNVTIEDNRINETTKTLAFSNAMNIVAQRNNITTTTGDAIIFVGAKDIIAQHNIARKSGATSGYFASATSTPTRQNIGNILTGNTYINFGSGVIWPSNTPLTEVDSTGNHLH